MQLLGERSWWLPRWLDRVIPEGGARGPRPAPAPPRGPRSPAGVGRAPRVEPGVARAGLTARAASSVPATYGAAERRRRRGGSTAARRAGRRPPRSRRRSSAAGASGPARRRPSRRAPRAARDRRRERAAELGGGAEPLGQLARGPARDVGLRRARVVDHLPVRQVRRATSSAAACAIAAVSEKLPAAIDADAALARGGVDLLEVGGGQPDVPITTATPRSIAASAFAFTTWCDVKSISTSTPSSASRRRSRTPSAPRRASPVRRPSARRRCAARGRRRRGRRRRARCPVQPVAPAMQIAVIGAGTAWLRIRSHSTQKSSEMPLTGAAPRPAGGRAGRAGGGGGAGRSRGRRAPPPRWPRPAPLTSAGDLPPPSSAAPALAAASSAVSSPAGSAASRCCRHVGEVAQQPVRDVLDHRRRARTRRAGR